MDFELFRKHQTQFHRDFAIPLDIESRKDKLAEEYKEFTDNPCIEEACDLLNVTVSILCDCFGVKDPLLRAMLKLEENSRRYLKNGGYHK